MARIGILLAALLLLTSALPNIAMAQETQPSASQLAWQAATKAATLGPSDMTLGDQAILHLPAEMIFVPKAEAMALMKAWGNGTDDRIYGLVAPLDENQYWVISITHTADGFVKDDDARNWDAGELLQSLKDGTEAQNQQRQDMGMKALDVTGWIEPPAYDAANHRLVWSLKAVERGAATGQAATVNYNTYALGRDGYFEIDLLTDDRAVEREKPYARNVLAALDYKPGKRYDDFNASTDHIAEYGLAALIGGVVAKKLGFLALAGVFLAKFAKVILIGLAVAGGGALKFFRGKRNSTG